MRSDIHEPGQGKLTSMTRRGTGATAAIPPSAVDAALGDEAAPILAPRGSRREIAASGMNADFMHIAVDGAHPPASAARADVADGSLLRQLSRQLNLLEIQQQQIRRLIEHAERRAAGAS